jgi:hypothetical protein
MMATAADMDKSDNFPDLAGVGVYFVLKNTRIFACSTTALTYRWMSSPERIDAMKRMLTWAGIPYKDWGRGEPGTMEEFGSPADSATATLVSQGLA